MDWLSPSPPHALRRLGLAVTGGASPAAGERRRQATCPLGRCCCEGNLGQKGWNDANI